MPVGTDLKERIHGRGSTGIGREGQEWVANTLLGLSGLA